MHERNIVHRDLKPENLLLQNKDNDSDIRLADFGFAKRVKGKLSLRTQCGTPGYVAPEILRGERYGLAVDMWSIGEILVFREARKLDKMNGARLASRSSVNFVVVSNNSIRSSQGSSPTSFWAATPPSTTRTRPRCTKGLKRGTSSSIRSTGILSQRRPRISSAKC